MDWKTLKEIYHFILESLGIADTSRVVCVGDSIEHDIAGGITAGLATALVRTGILDELSDEDREELYRRFHARPNHLLDSFC